jgi:iron-sulfur cluster assembly protein
MSVQTVKPQAITLTPAAAEHIQSYLTKNPEAIGFRLGIKDAGCSNKKYASSYVTSKEDDDAVYQDKDINLYVAKPDLRYLAGTEIDFVQDGINKVLRFNNPLAKNACGCGESFDVEK